MTERTYTQAELDAAVADAYAAGRNAHTSEVTLDASKTATPSVALACQHCGSPVVVWLRNPEAQQAIEEAEKRGRLGAIGVLEQIAERHEKRASEVGRPESAQMGLERSAFGLRNSAAFLREELEQEES